MNTQKAVYNKLFSKKTELETHKVELGLVDDLNAQKSKAQDLIKSINSGIDDAGGEELKLYKLQTELEETKKRVEKKYDKLLRESKSADKLKREMDTTSEKIEKAVKELGLNVSDIKNYKEWDKSYTRLITITNEIEDRYDEKYG